MATYFALLSLPSILAMASRRTAGWAALAPVFLIFVIIVGFRYHVGMDWRNYEAIHFAMGTRSLESALFGQEPLSNGLFWISKHYFGGSMLTNLVAAAILLVGVFALASRTADPWIAVVAATPYLIVVIGMSGIRQGMAMGVFLFALSRWHESTTTRRMIYVFIASLFHASALILTIFVVHEMKMRTVYKISLGVAFGVVGAYFATQSDIYARNIAFYEYAYVGENRVDAPGAVMHLAIVALPAAIFLALRKSRMSYLNDVGVVYLGSAITLGLFLLLPISSMAVSRLSIYLQFIPMIVYASLVHAYGPSSRIPIRFAIVALHFLYLFVWLNYANNAAAYRSYYFLFFS